MSSSFTAKALLSWNTSDSSAMNLNTTETETKSPETLPSPLSFLISQGSEHSKYNNGSTRSVQSELNVSSTRSIQSQLSFCSEGSICSIPSLGIDRPPGRNLGDDVYQCIATLRGHGGCMFSLAMAGNLLYSGSSGDDMRVWGHPELSEHSKFSHGDGAVKCIWFLAAGYTARIKIIKSEVWKRGENIQPSEHKLVVTMPELKDYVMNAIPPKKYFQERRHKNVLWIEHLDTISTLSVDRNGFLYSASWDRTVKIWKPSDLRCVESFRAHDDAINALVVSPDGFVYTGSVDSRIKIWSKAFGERKHSLVAIIKRCKSAINALALGPNGSILYSGACDRSIIVWEREES